MPTRIGVEVYQWLLPPLSLFKETLLKWFELQFLVYPQTKLTLDLEAHDRRNPLLHKPLIVPISASLGCALRQASVRQCFQRSCDKPSTGRRAGHVFIVCPATHSSPPRAILHNDKTPHIVDPRGRTSLTRRPTTHTWYQGSLPNIAH